MYLAPVSVPHTDVLIVGCGPAGASAAWRLAKEGHQVTIVDKSTFPRDKICGDALSGKAITLLRRFDPQAVERLLATQAVEPIWGIRFVAPNGKPIEVPFQDPLPEDRLRASGFVSRRIDYDKFLVDEIRRYDEIDLQLGVHVTEIERESDGWRLRSRDGTWQHTCRLLLLADGAQSSFARKEAGLSKRPAHHAAAVRAYMSGVTGFHPDGYIELHFLKEYLPGYFWAFPLPNGSSNIGLGMRTDKLKARGLSLRDAVHDIIEAHPQLASRFEGATLEEKVVGYPLPLGSKLRRASGDGYMILGDAGHMIDPLTGEGIGNGMYAGVIAAEQALVSLRQNDLSAAGLSDYDVRIKRVLGREMEVSYRIQRSLRWPWIVNGLANFINSRPAVTKLLSRMYTDLELRAQVAKPKFWVKTALGRMPA